MKVLVLGASGAMGSVAVSLLVRGPEPVELTLAARGAAGVDQIAGAWSRAGIPVRALPLDVTGADVARDFAGHDVILSCAGPAFETEEAGLRAALDAKVPYVSLCDDHDTFLAARALDAAAKSAGVPAVIGCGLSPGITNFLYVLAAAELDEVQDSTVAVAGAISDAMGPAALRQLQSSPGDTPRPVYFPEPVGWVETFRRPQPEAASLPGSVEIRTGLTERGAMDVVRATSAAGPKWAGLSRRLAPAARLLPPRGPAWSAARVDVRGSRSGTAAAVILGVVDRLANLAAGTVVRAALAAGEGRIQPGVHAAHEALGAPETLASLARGGVRIARLEPEPV